MSEERLRWTGVVFAAWIVALVMANVAAFFWTLVGSAFVEAPGDMWTTTARVRMIHPVLGFTIALAHAPIAIGSGLALRAVTREPGAHRLAVLVTAVLAMLATGFVALSYVKAVMRVIGGDLETLRFLHEIVGTLLMLTLATSLALPRRARAAGAAAVVLLVVGEVVSFLSVAYIVETDLVPLFASVAVKLLVALAAWIAIGIALRRARPIAAPPDSIASTFA